MAPPAQAAPAEPDDDDDDEPAPAAAAPVVGHGGQPMSAEAIAKKTARIKRQTLREEYGTTDPAQIEQIKAERATKLAEYETLKKEADERKRAAQSTEERLAADVAKLTADKAALEAKLAERDQQVLTQRQEAAIATAAAGHKFKAGSMKFVKFELASHFDGLSRTEQQKFGPQSLDKWLADFAKGNPELIAAEAPAPVAGEPPAAAAPRAPAAAAARRVPVGPVRTAVPPKAATNQATPADPLAGKTPRPRQPNSMTTQELRQYLRAQGRHTWG